MKRNLGSWLLALATAMVAVNCSIAQQYEDTFDTLDPAWGEPDAYMFIQDGVMVMKADPGYCLKRQNQGMIFEEVDASLKVRQVAGDKLSLPAGLVFWASSYDNFYLLGVTADGSLTVYRQVKGKWLTPIPYRTCDALKKGLDEWNELRVVTSGNQAALHVNGTEIMTIKGQPPTDGSFVGFYCESPSDGQLTFEFDDLRVQ